MSSNGQVIVGQGTSSHGDRAFRWSASTGTIESLGALPTATVSIGQACSAAHGAFQTVMQHDGCAVT